MPGPTIPSNLPAEALRWTLLRAAKEIGFISAPTLASRLRDSGEQPDAGDCWSTSQVLGAAYGGDLHSQRVREVAERADAWALKNAIVRADYLSRADIEDLFRQLAESIRTVINASQLSAEEKTGLFRELSGFKIRIATVAERQRRAKTDEGQQNGDGAAAGEPSRKRRGRPKKQAAAV